MAGKLKVVMICAHEPGLDPRIHWEAAAAAGRFEVTVLGFNRPDGSLPPSERRDGYRIVRRPYAEASALRYLWLLKDIVPRRYLLPAAFAGALFYPLVVVAEIVFRLLRAAWRFVGRNVLTLALLLRPLRSGGRSHRHVLARLQFIMGQLRTQFAPAVEIFWNDLCETPEKPDVVHCNDLDTLLVGILAKRHFGCRVVYDAHEFWPVADSLCTWIDTTFFTWVERALIGQADAVVTVNPLLAEEMRRAYRLPRVYSVPNVEPWREDRPAVTSAMSELAAGRVKFLFQGRFTLARGIDELIRAWPQVDGRRAALFLRGPDNGWRHRAIEDAARLGVLDSSVYFLDAVSEEELVSAAAEADVGIVPYLPLAINERLSCPNKLSQYLHAGLMILSNALPYVRSVVEEAGAGTHYDSARLATFVEAVDRIAADPELLRRAKENARRFARDSFNWQAYQNVLLDLYAGPREGAAPRPAMAGGEPVKAASS